jgi:carbon monoxide dehydrogenase subunit G
MPEVEVTTTMSLPPEDVWAFVRDMNNWAPFLTGYQRHEILSETDSIWWLKGDVGILSREVQLQAHVVEWNGPERVVFTLTGLNEPVEGGGELAMSAATAGEAAPAPARRGLVRRLLDAIFGWFFRRAHGTVKRLPAAAPASHLRFTLRMEAGGPTGPLVNALLAPALRPAAEDLAQKIAAHLEGQRAG